MSNFNGRRPPNVSQYLANLNTIPSAQELAAQQNQNIEFNEADLDFLTHTEFFDFDQFHPVNGQRFPPGTGPVPASAPEGVDGAKAAGLNGAQYSQFGEFQTYPPTVASTPTSLHGAYAHPSPTGHYGATTPPQVGDKRKASANQGIPSGVDLEDSSRMAAEEDKRRRNTAASARFRVKKKQREAALEKQAKEMADKVSLLEGKVQQLEMENKWLKGLITDKNGGQVPEMVAKKVEVAEERSTEPKKRGIGTATAEEKEDEE